MNRSIIILFGLAGISLGVGFYTFLYAKGYSYLTNDPAACTNCHVMNEHFNGWVKSSHHAVARCNDCHAPHDFLGKWAVKASNGFWHSLAFTTGYFPDAIQIRPVNTRVVEGACRYCHRDMVEIIDHMDFRKGDVSCVRCHLSVGHLH